MDTHTEFSMDWNYKQSFFRDKKKNNNKKQ